MNERLTLSDSELRRLEGGRRGLRWVIMGLVLAAVFVVSLFLGRYKVPPAQVFAILGRELLRLPIEPTWTETAATVVISVRLPRAIMAVLIGAGLSMSGASFQGMFQNPLVDPFVLGVSAGASFGAAVAIVLGLNAVGIQLLAFLCGLLAVTITYFLAHVLKTTPVLMLVLSGLVVSAFFQAMLSVVKYTADTDDKLPAITFWLMGSLSTVDFQDLAIAAGPFVLALAGLFLVRWKLNILSMGDREARSLGVNSERYKLLIIVCTTVITSISVAFCGIIGWVGQVIPHVCRMIVGPDHKVLIPATMLVGATYLLIIDNLCRLVSTNEIPLGILTAVVGAPVFAYLLRKTRGGWK